MTRKESFAYAISSSALWGGAGKAIGILKHVVIAGAIGLTAQLDAFYASTSILAVFIFLWVGMFDVLGIPKLIELEEKGDDAGFNRLARSLFTSSLVVGVLSFAVIVIFRNPLTFLAMGFEESRKTILINGLLLIAPLALVFFPFRQLAAINRAKRFFSIYYQAEFLVTLTWFLVIFIFRDVDMVLFWAWPAGAAAGLIFLGIRSPYVIHLIGNPFVPEAKAILSKGIVLALLQGLLALHIAVDHFFSSFLPVGGLGALSLSMVIVTALTGLLRLETSYISIFGQSTNTAERDRSVNKLIGFGLLVGIPYAVSLIFLGELIVRILFQHGVFSSADTGKMTLVLAAYAPAVLAMILLPPIEEIYQVLEKLTYIVWRALFGLFLNIVFCYVFVFQLDIGNVGIAMATTLSMTGTLIFGLLGLKRVGVTVHWLHHVKSAGKVLAASLLIASLSWLMSKNYGGVLVDLGILSSYCVALVCTLLCLPVDEAVAIRVRLRAILIN